MNAPHQSYPAAPPPQFGQAPAAPPAPAQAPAAQAPAGAPGQPVALHRNPEQGPPQMVDLFSIDGRTYQIPAKPRVSVALRYLWHAKQYGENAAVTELLESLLGREGFEALVNYDDLEPDDFAKILAAAQKVVMGALEQPAGGSASGR